MKLLLPHHAAPPVAPHTVNPVQPTLALPSSPWAHPGNAPVASNGAVFKVPHHLRHAARLRPPARRQRAGAKGASAGGPPGLDDLPDETDAAKSLGAVQVKAGQLQSGGSFGGDDERGKDREDRQAERRAKLIARVLPRFRAQAPDGEPVAQLLAQAQQAQSPQDLAPALRSAVAESGPSLARLMVRVAQAWQTGRAGEPPLSKAGPAAQLALVKTALVAGAHLSAPPSDHSLIERRACASIGLPVFLLNLSRPRTQQQQQQAAERLAAISRALARPTSSQS